jgi:small-conductance mechanosensitive channel
MALAASLVIRAKPMIKPEFHEKLSYIIEGPWIWMTIGASLLSASASHFGGSFFIFTLPGILCLIYGLSTLSWRLRIISKPDLRDTPSPLSRLNKPAGVAIALLFMDLPIGAMTVLWVATLFIFLQSLRKGAGNEKAYKNLLLAERFAYGNTIFFALVSLLISICGFARLAILIFMALYTLVNVIILGSALVTLAARACELVFDPQANPVKHAVIKALAIPVSFLISLVSALPWLWAVPGSNNLLASLMSQGYTIGDASFDFSRLVLIIMLFFLFRSLKGLGVTSLEHLPDTLPNIEKGGIPPLKGLFTYLLWIVFALISLMLVGVNFSSLAVVVGGLSVGVGLGMQALISNLTSGLILIFGRTLLVNDWVDVGSVSGRVVSIDIRCTVLETSEMALVYVPNSVIMGSQFTNWTRNNRRCRKKLNFSAVYGTDVNLAKSLLLQAALGDQDVVKTPPPAVTVNDLSETAVVLTLAVTIRDTDLEVTTKSRLREEAYRLFNENGIAFYTRNIELNLDGKAIKAT